MKLEPIITEKTINLTKNGEYTFEVDRNASKYQIKKTVEKLFGVHVKKVRTVSIKGEVKRTFWGRKRIIKPCKKAIVKLAEKEKIDLFEEAKK